jgi:hypothetical protein
MSNGNVHAMLDIETTDNRDTAAVLSIAAVFFTRDSVIETFSSNLRLQPQLDCGRTVGEYTLRWWLTQASQEARERAFLSSDRRNYHDAFNDLCDRIEKFAQTNPKGFVDVWGNGSDFDNVVLRSAAKAMGINRSWNYRGNRCYRTLVGTLDPDKKLYVPPEVAHDPLEDALAQAMHLSAIQEAYPAINIL